MDPIKIIKDFEKYLNVEVPKFLGYDESYTVSIENHGTNIDILLSSSTGASTISGMWISPTNENEELLSQLETHFTEYLSVGVPGIIQASVTINYEPESININFKTD